ncbi:Vacuolar protein 8, partial [Ascosphaera acerosa]
YYCTTALSNIAVDAANRATLAATEPSLVASLVALMDSTVPKVQCQAALALRNLASDSKYQLDVVRAGGLPALHRLLQSSYTILILSAVACIRNISIHPANEAPIIEEGFLRPLVDLLGSLDNEEIQCHAISTLRNLAASSDRNKELVLMAGAVQKCKALVLRMPVAVQAEMTAAIAVLALADELKPQLLRLGIFEVLIPLTGSENLEVQGNSAAALGNLSSKVSDYSIFIQSWTEPAGGIHGYLVRFLASGDPTFQHIAVWTLLQLLESGDKRLVSLIARADDVLPMVRMIAGRSGGPSTAGTEGTAGPRAQRRREGSGAGTETSTDTETEAEAAAEAAAPARSAGQVSSAADSHATAPGQRRRTDGSGGEGDAHDRDSEHGADNGTGTGNGTETENGDENELDDTDGERDVIALAQRSLELLGYAHSNGAAGRI